ncbi:MAG TPA: HK97 family phage prohead protease [Candidatus Angelobacter sp.]|nr:HK97 family phage prohead protease [Candidatus Angelobacter sp.]
MTKQERRILTTEFRVAKTGKATRLSGYAAVYNSDSEDLGGFTEQIAPGAFDAVLAAGPDVRALVNHDPSLLLGRTLSGTLTLRSDSKGLFYDVLVPDTQLGRDTLALAERGDITQSSFGFTIDEDDEDAQEWFDRNGNKVARWSSGGVKRVIRKIGGLFDVSPVTYPAYTASSVQARNGDRGIAEARRFLQSRRQPLSATDERARQEARTFLHAHKN